MWLGNVGANKYGKWTWNRQTVMPHQLAFFFSNDRWCKEGLVIRHICHNNLCCEPSHLIEGTQAQNIDDMIKADRHNCGKGDRHGWKLHPELIPRGEQASQAILTENQVRKIYKLTINREMTQKEISLLYRIDQSTVSYIKTRRLWKHLNM